MPRTNTIDDVHQELTCLIKDDAVFKPVLWIGLFGSMSRSTHNDTSDIDLLVAYAERTSAKGESWACRDIFCTIDLITRKVEKHFDRRVQLSHLTEHKVTTYLELEALLTSVTVYGADEWAKNLRELSRQYLDDGYIRLKMAYQSLKDMESLISKTHEKIFLTTPDKRVLESLTTIATFLDFSTDHPFHNGLFTPILTWVQKEKELLERVKTSSLNDGDLGRVWKLITERFTNYPQYLMAAYIPMVEGTYALAKIELPVV